MKTNTRHWASITAGILSLAGYATAASLGSEKYTYDASGNIIEKSIDGLVTKMSYDNANQVTAKQATGQSSEMIAYDAAGRPVIEQNASGHAICTKSYGYGDKVLATQNRDSQTGFYYNAEGQIVGKKTDSNVSTYTWDGNVLAANSTEAFTNEDHVTGGVPVMAANRDAIVSDYLGNTLSQANQSFTSTAFGEGLEEVRFTGKVFVKELGGYSFLHRLFAPELSRWTTRDPSGFPDGSNNYEYALCDPTSQVDVLGLNTAPASCSWSPTIPNQVTGVIATFSGELVWSVVEGSESHSINMQPGWSGSQTYRGRTVSATDSDSTSWTASADGNFKRIDVKLYIHYKETSVNGAITQLGKDDKIVSGPWIEL